MAKRCRFSTNTEKTNRSSHVAQLMFPTCHVGHSDRDIVGRWQANDNARPSIPNASRKSSKFKLTTQASTPLDKTER